MIKSVVRCSNDLVMVFDEKGEQVPEYQGYYRDVRENILRDTPPDAAFSHFFDTVPGLEDVSREDW
jgi:hypothetical protein